MKDRPAWARHLLVVLMLVTTTFALMPPAAIAAPWYYYKPGHPMNRFPSTSSYCTGSWAVRGTDGMFFLTAGHCVWDNGTPTYPYDDGNVYGRDAQFAEHARNEHRSTDGCTSIPSPNGGMDAQLVRPKAGVDAFQIVVAPTWEIGRVVGVLHNSQLRQGQPIGKSGRQTGWTEGKIIGAGRWCNGEEVFFADYVASDGDSGAPVLIRNTQGVYAAGMHVGNITTGSGFTASAFISIDWLLSRFGVQLPVFATSGGAVAPLATDLNHHLPYIAATQVHPH